MVDYMTRLTRSLGIDFTQQEISIRELLKLRSDKHPDKIFAIYPDENNREETYQSLYQTCVKFARYLNSMGMTKGSKVAFLVQNGSDAVHILLSIMFAGFVAVPIKEFWHQKQIVDIVMHSDASAFIISSYYQKKFPQLTPILEKRIVVYNEMQLKEKKTRGKELLFALESKDDALLVYTSGTTSNSKGVLQTHASLIRPTNTVCNFNEDDICLCVLPIYNKNTITVSLLTVIIHGGCIVLPVGFRLKGFWQWVIDFQCTWFALVPAIVTQLLYDNVAVASLPHVRFARCSSAPLVSSHHLEFEQKFTIPLIEAMGSTETGNIFCNPLPPNINKVGSPGIPSLCEIRVVDHREQDMPQGEVGELMVCSRGNMKEYYKNSELTAAVKKGAWCYTGDLGYLDKDGYFFVVGRKKEIIIKGGQNIFPREIELVLLKHSAVKDAAVVGKEDELLGEEVIAYVILEEMCTGRQLKEFCTEHLTALQIPSQIYMVARFPRNSNGKVQKWRFNENHIASQSSTKSIPKDKIKAITKIWNKFFQCEVDIDANFFELGGNSLELAQILNEVRLTFASEISLMEVFQNVSIRGMASCIKEETSITIENIIPIERRTYPLSYHQHQQWLLEKLYPQQSLYNMPHIYEIEGKLNVVALEQAFHFIVERHQVLRTRIVVENDVPVQVVVEDKFVVGKQDLRNNNDKEKVLKRSLQQQIEKSFDLECDFTLRADLYRMKSDKFVLLIVIHHIVSDRYAMKIFFSELKEIYAAIINERSPCLPILHIQYKDYTCWQQWQGDNFLSPQLAYWQDKLKGYEKLQLRSDFSDAKNFSGAMETFFVSCEVFEKLQAIAHQQQTTLFVLLNATFHCFLSHYYQQSDIVTGFTSAGRHHPQLENLIGYFVNTLVLRSYVKPDMSFTEYLATINNNAMEAYQNQDLPFEKLVAKIETDRNWYDNPIFNVMFALNQKQNIFDLQLQNCNIVQKKYRNVSRFPLSLSLFEEQQTLYGEFRYRTELFRKETVQNMVAHYTQLLKSIAANPQQKVSQLNLISDDEKVKYKELAGKELPLVHNTGIHEIFARQVEKTPHKVAVILEEEQFTYLELYKKAQLLAAQLHINNIESQQVIAIFTERSLYTVTAILAILQAGGAYTVIEPDYSQQRTSYIMNDSSISMVITTRKYADRFTQKCIYIEDEYHEKREIKPFIHNDNNAYVIYTSGSTGTPKGVEICHFNLCNYVTAMTDALKIGENDVYLHSASFMFSSSVRQLFLPLCVGATIVIAAKRHMQNPQLLGSYICKHNVTILDFVPSYAKAFITQNMSAKLLDNTLRMILSASEALLPTLAKEWRDLLGEKVQLYNMYGQTETCGIVSIYKINDNDFSNNKFISIGRPIANTRIHIMNDQQQTTPMGVVGIMYVDGFGVGKGYINQPNETDKKFIKRGKSHIYCTGDLARWSSQGNIEFIGRKDQQAKVRGFRVEPGEIEITLLQHSEVEKVVVAVKEQQDNEQLIAYMITKNNKNLSFSLLRQWLQDKLPSYMIPTHFIKLDIIPTTASGKVDYQALPTVDESIIQTTYAPPQTFLQRQLVDIWQDILQRENIGIHDNFFHLGGHSLLIIKMLHKIQQILQVSVSLPAFFTTPTIKKLAKCIVESDEFFPIDALNQKQYPLSYAQQRVWFLQLLSPDSSFYNSSIIEELQGNFDIQILQQAVDELVKRQSILRTYIEQDDTGNVWQKQRNDTISLTVIDVSPQQVNVEIEKETKTPFNLAQFPLVRFKIMRFDAQRFIICITLHHILTDNWSRAILYRELKELYNSFRQKRLPKLPSLLVQYGDFSIWQKQLDMESQKAYWNQQFATPFPQLQIPTDYKRPLNQSYQGASFSFSIDEGLTSELQLLAQQNDSTLFMALFCAYCTLLYRYSNQQDIVVGLPISNRTQRETENVIGFFVNILAMRITFNDDLTWNELLQHIKKTCINAYTFQDYPFEKLVEDLNPPRDMSRNPIFQTMFNMIEEHDRHTSTWQDMASKKLQKQENTTKFDISLYVYSQKELRFRFKYSTDLFTKDTISRMARHFVELLRSVVVNPHDKLHQIPILQKEDVLLSVVDKKLKYQELSIVDMITESISQVPRKTALVGNNINYTYAQLGKLSDNICAALQNLGVSSKSRVALLGSGSVNTVVAMLGILKSGATCIPLNPNFMTTKTLKILEEVDVVLHEEDTYGRLDLQQVQTMKIEHCTHEQNVLRKQKLYKHQVAFIIYTSGSTGAANGVVITHNNVASKVQTIAKSLGVTSKDVCILTASISFIAAVRQILTPLVQQASLVVIKPDVLSNPQRLFTEIVKQKVTMLDFVPSYCNACGQSLLNNKKLDLSNVRQIATSGEKLSLDIVLMWRKLIPGVRFLNMYGQTETSAAVALYNVPRDTHCVTQNVPVGRAIGNNRIYLLNSHLEFVPQGVVGDIYIESDEIAQGYYKDALHTAMKFIANPFGKGTLYKTNDQGRYNKEKQLEIVARTDAVIKVRGYRVDTLEIEVALREHKNLQDATVVLNEELLQAYIVADENLEYKEIRQHLQAQLPEYMIPQKIKTISALPMTDSRKTDYLALRELDQGERFLFTPVWILNDITQTKIEKGTFLLFTDDVTTCESSTAIVVNAGKKFAIDKNKITIDYNNEQDYIKLVAHLKNIDFDFKKVIYACNSVEFLTKFVKGFEEYLSQMRIAIVCRNVFPVKNSKKLVAENAMIVGAARVLPLEYPGLRYACIDMQNEIACDAIFGELREGLPDANVAYVKGKRYTLNYQYLACNEIPIQDGQVYLITGGLGNIGLQIAISLAQKAKINIAITTRAIDKITQKQQAILEKIKKSGSKIVVFETGLEDVTQVAQMIKEIEVKWGGIYGVLHCAGTRERFARLNLHGIIEEKSHFKTHSTKLLIEVLAKTTTRFMIIFSSLSSLFGRYGQAGYAATNAYLDTLANSNTSDLHVVAVNWDVWRELPMSIADHIPKDMAELIRRDAQRGISNEQAIKALLALPINSCQVVVSRRPEITGYHINELIRSNVFVAPRTDIEKQICKIWANVLQVDKVSIEDDFFALGGHSLLVVTIMNKIRKLLGIEEQDSEKLPLAMMIIHPTIKQFVQAIDNLEASTHEIVIQMNCNIPNKLPVFLLHAAGVDPIAYHYLCQSLDGVVTAYTIRTHELDKFASIEETARYLIQKIRSIQPKGPYFLGGMCMGGLVVYEVAKRLHEEGEEIKLAFMMDTINIPGMKKYKTRKRHKFKKLLRKIKNTYKVIEFIGHALILDIGFIRKKMQRIKNNIKRKAKKISDPRAKLKKKMRDRMRAMRDSYNPQPYNGEIVYIRSEKEAGKYTLARLQKLAKNVKCHQVKGTIHRDVARPHFADATAKVIEKYL